MMNIESRDPNSTSSFHTAWWTPRLAWPLIAAAVLRMGLLATVLVRTGTSILISTDTGSYLGPGRNLLLHGRFFANGVPDLFRTPGYSLFLAITSLAGLPVAVMANTIVSIFSVLLVWKLARTTFGDDRIALGAAWIFAFEPVSVSHSFVLISETLFLALFLLSMERLAVFLRGRRLPVLVAAGLWLAAATFVRPVSYYLPFALSLGLFLVFARVPGFPPQRHEPVAGGPGLRWKAPAVLLISVLPWLAAWQIRNWVETGFRGFASVQEVSLYFCDAADVKARMEHRDYYDVLKESGYPDFRELFILSNGQLYLSQAYLAQHPEQIGWSQGQRIAFIHTEALHVIRAHYGIFLQSCLESLFRTVFELGIGALHHLLIPEADRGEAISIASVSTHGGILRAIGDPWILAERAVFSAALLGLYVFAARGAFRGGMHNACVWLLLGTSLYFITVSATAVSGRGGGGARYRLPVMPAICILAAAGFLRTKTMTIARCTGCGSAPPPSGRT